MPRCIGVVRMVADANRGECASAHLRARQHEYQGRPRVQHAAPRILCHMADVGGPALYYY